MLLLTQRELGLTKICIKTSVLTVKYIFLTQQLCQNNLFISLRCILLLFTVM